MHYYRELFFTILWGKEYNPIHIHTHCELSSVLWLEVPKRMLDEAKKNETNAANPGNISFIYGEESWGSLTERHYAPTVNTLFIFPAALRHHVMHFNSKVTRTSVAGNIRFYDL